MRWEGHLGCTGREAQFMDESDRHQSARRCPPSTKEIDPELGRVLLTTLARPTRRPSYSVRDTPSYSAVARPLPGCQLPLIRCDVHVPQSPTCTDEMVTSNRASLAGHVDGP